MFELITIKRKDESKPPRAFTDYEVEIDRNKVPGVDLIEML